MRKTRISIITALALLIALLFALRQSSIGRAGSSDRTWQQPRTGDANGMIAQTLAITPSIDTSVRSLAPNANFASDNLAIGVDGTNRSNTLLYFQVEGGPVPYQAIVNSATLKLSLSGGSQIATTISARAVITDWAGFEDKSKWESNVTWNTRPGITTTVAAQATIAPGNDLSMDITALYAGWLNDPGNNFNYGITLSGKAEATAYEYQFNSREIGSSPVIEVNFTPQPTKVTIEKTVGAVTIDNVCSPSEYPSSSYKYVDTGLHYSPVYVAHDDEYLYFCAENVASTYDKRFYALYIDTDLGKEARAEEDDLAFYTNPITKKSDNEWGNSVDKFTPIPCLIIPEPESCDGNSTVKLKNWEALSGVPVQGQPVEVAEYKIKLDLIGVNCQGRKIGMSFYHHWVNDIADDYGWPTDRWFNEPRTWIEASFDQLPASLPATCATVTPFPTVTPSLFLPLIAR